MSVHDERCWKVRADPMDEVARPGRSLIAADGFLLQPLNLKEWEQRRLIEGSVSMLSPAPANGIRPPSQ